MIRLRPAALRQGSSFDGGDQNEEARDELLARYIIEFRSGRYYTHPVIRETLLMHSSGKQRGNAHLAAGHYYAAAFRAKQMVGRAETLGARFIEARYHFTLGNSEKDLSEIANRFETHLRFQFNFTSKIPSDPQELDERISLLSALLKDRGPRGLEYHLGRCLLSRNQANDLRRALPHLRRSTGPKFPAAAWVLRMQVEYQLYGMTEAIKAAREGVKVVPPTQNLFSLYQAAGEILARDGKLEDAVALLREGIKVVPPTQSLSSLYQAAGEILARDGKLEDAVALLREGNKVVPPTQISSRSIRPPVKSSPGTESWKTLWRYCARGGNELVTPRTGISWQKAQS